MQFSVAQIKNTLWTRARSLDKGILYGAFLLLLCGVFLTLSTGPAVARREHFDVLYFVRKQFVFIPMAVGVLLVTALMSLNQIRALSRLVLIGGILGMIWVVFFGGEVKGASRWINVFGFSVQPSEFVKPAFAVMCAWLLSRGRLIRHSSGYVLAPVLFLIVAGLLIMQPDIGMMLTVAAIFGVQLFLSGIPVWVVGLCLAALGGMGGFAYIKFDHVSSRINRFFNPAKGEAYQVEKSMETLKNAGWFGKGPGEGVVKYDLPDAHTDFIMAVSAEEFGFFITAAIIFIFIFILWRGVLILRRENNFFSQIAIGGLLTQITFQAIVNIGSTLNLLPTKGMTLPLISYGGSSLLSMAFAFGVILALTHGRTLSKGLE